MLKRILFQLNVKRTVSWVDDVHEELNLVKKELISIERVSNLALENSGEYIFSSQKASFMVIVPIQESGHLAVIEAHIVVLTLDSVEPLGGDWLEIKQKKRGWPSKEEMLCRSQAYKGDGSARPVLWAALKQNP